MTQETTPALFGDLPRQDTPRAQPSEAAVALLARVPTTPRSSLWICRIDDEAAALELRRRGMARVRWLPEPGVYEVRAMEASDAG